MPTKLNPNFLLRSTCFLIVIAFLSFPKIKRFSTPIPMRRRRYNLNPLISNRPIFKNKTANTQEASKINRESNQAKLKNIYVIKRATPADNAMLTRAISCKIGVDLCIK